MSLWDWVVTIFVVLPIMVLWIGCIIDAISRPDIGGFPKLLWVLAILVFPVVGSLVYIFMRPKVVVAQPTFVDEAWQSKGAIDAGIEETRKYLDPTIQHP